MFMKFYKRVNQIVYLALLALLFNACSTIQRIEARKHGGAAVNHLDIQQKNDIQLSGNLVTSFTDNNAAIPSRQISLNGYQGSLCYGLTNNLAISSSINYMAANNLITVENKRGGDGYFDVEKYAAKASATDFRGALHYYLIDTLDKKAKWKVGQYYGIGFGAGNTISNGDLQRLTTENSNERAWIRGVHHSNYFQVYLQNNYNLMNRIFDINIGNNLVMLRNNMKARQLSKQEKNTAFFWQPSIRTSLGYKPVKLFTQLDWIMPLNKQLFDFEQYFYISLGIQIKLNTNNF